MHAEWLNAVAEDIISLRGIIVIAWPAKYLILSRFAAGRHSSPGDPNVFSAAWEGNEKQNSKTACFTHSWAVLAAAVSQRHPSNVLGDVSNICHMLFVLSSSSQGWVLCSGLVSNVHAFIHLLKTGGLQKCMFIHRQSCSQNCDGHIEWWCCLTEEDSFAATFTLTEFNFA